MQAVTNPIALDLASEVKKAVAPNEFVNDTLNRNNELEQLRDYMKRREQKIESASMEKMVIMAIQNAFPAEAIETMRAGAGITEARLAELREQANKA